MSSTQTNNVAVSPPAEPSIKRWSNRFNAIAPPTPTPVEPPEPGPVEEPDEEEPDEEEEPDTPVGSEKRIRPQNRCGLIDDSHFSCCASGVAQVVGGMDNTLQRSIPHVALQPLEYSFKM